ncbi:hypothetical protein JAAARDRAFT_291797 [Jaapia argillacea MUCL 33604]|uniref:Uncharacterized protein n=1 Tax=Jaapia argillacea MUCL 33604 TaxID=933084 RepID=A0A067Q3X9_9AGAM|nr:hypothetical protein JAAARDRAFT_291797 [Jaapia argillacea MUCL 33604]
MFARRKIVSPSSNLGSSCWSAPLRSQIQSVELKTKCRHNTQAQALNLGKRRRGSTRRSDFWNESTV